MKKQSILLLLVIYFLLSCGSQSKTKQETQNGSEQTMVGTISKPYRHQVETE